MAKIIHQKTCVMCGAVFETTDNRKIVCGPECREARRSEQNRKYSNARYRERKAKKDAWEAEEKAKVAAREEARAEARRIERLRVELNALERKHQTMYGEKYPARTLEQAQAEARERGMTYGQYMTWLYFHRDKR